MEAFFVQLASDVIAQMFKQLILNLPALMAGIRTINTSTAVTAPAATPAQIDEAQQAAAAAVAAGKMPAIQQM